MLLLLAVQLSSQPEGKGRWEALPVARAEQPTTSMQRPAAAPPQHSMPGLAPALLRFATVPLNCVLGFCAWIRRLQVDATTAIFLGVGYIITAIIIFTLQHGYIDLFN